MTSDPLADAMAGLSDPPPKRARKSAGGSGASGASDSPRQDGPPDPPKRTPALRKLEDRLNEFLGIIPMGIAATGDIELSMVVAGRTPAMASAWIDLAAQNTGVKRVIEKMVEGSAWGGVIISTTAVALPIAQRTGIYRGPDPFAMLYGGGLTPSPATPGDTAADHPGGGEPGRTTPRPGSPDNGASPVRDGVVDVGAVDRSTMVQD